MCGSRPKPEERYPNKKLFLLKLFQAFQEYVADAAQRFSADLVECVLRRVPVTVVYKITDDVD